MVTSLSFPLTQEPPGASQLRDAVRRFLAEELSKGTWTPSCDGWIIGWYPAFSRALGGQGWIGATWPRRYGGQEYSALERYVVIEELLAAGAPVAAHWIADRQVGPLLLRYGTEEQRQEFLPRITRGECYFAIGMSEPDAGSDLAAIRTSARRDAGGWRLNGRKLWTSGAHQAHASIVLCRTEPLGENRRAGMSQLLVDLAAPGITIRPIHLLNGEHHFNEVIFDDVFISDACVVGEPGAGWNQVMTELAFERSGPERFLSTFPLFIALLGRLEDRQDDHARARVGHLVAQLCSLRAMSFAVAGLLAAGETPGAQAALVKDLGTRFELEVIDVARSLVPTEPSSSAETPFERLLAQAILQSPGFTLRGGTSEILRGIIARGLGLR